MHRRLGKKSDKKLLSELSRSSDVELFLQKNQEEISVPEKDQYIIHDSDVFTNCVAEVKVDSRTLLSELGHTSSLARFLKRHKKDMVKQSLTDHLNMLLSKKGLSIADVVRGSLLDRTYVYQIFDGRRKPSRDKLIAIAFGLKLSEKETYKMLKLSGNRELYIRDERDVIILFALLKKKTIDETNELLDQYGYQLLGSVD